MTPPLFHPRGVTTSLTLSNANFGTTFGSKATRGGCTREITTFTMYDGQSVTHQLAMQLAY